MSSFIYRTAGTPITWKGSGGTYAITLAALANNAARQGAKGDLGDPRAIDWELMAEIEWQSAPTAGVSVPIYWSSSPSATAGTQNSGGASGADAAYQAGNEAAFVQQLELVGIFVATGNGSGTIQNMKFVFRPDHRYGMPVPYNTSGQAFATSGTNIIFTLTPLAIQAQ